MSAPIKTLVFIGLATTQLATSPAQASDPALQRIQDTIFTPICATCHSGIFGPHHLRLDARNSYRLLVGVPSAEDPSLQRVKSGDPDASDLIQKVDGRAKEGDRMPAGRQPLPSGDINLIRQWIGPRRTRREVTHEHRLNSHSPRCEPFIDVDDIAEVVVAALTDPRHVNRLYEVTGPRALTFAQAVAEISAGLGRPVRYTQITPEHFVASLKGYVPEDTIELLNELFTVVLDGRNTQVSPA